jgi:hypothetical protein
MLPSVIGPGGCLGVMRVDVSFGVLSICGLSNLVEVDLKNGFCSRRKLLGHG